MYDRTRHNGTGNRLNQQNYLRASSKLNNLKFLSKKIKKAIKFEKENEEQKR